MTKRYTKRRRHRRRTMKGGAFSQQELQQLQNNQFTQYQIQSLTDLGVSFNEVMQKINTIRNQEGFAGNQDDVAEQVSVELLNEYIFENPNTQHLDMDQSFDSQDSMHLSDLNASQGSLHLSDLDNSRMSGYTSYESNDEFGGRRIRRNSRKRRGKKARKTRKQRGGMCFGNGVGANSYDPNYSIYNTNMLKMFPYRPN
jgi:hypothetical protein